MDKDFRLLQNQFHEITVSLDRADRIQCDENWKGYDSVPPFSSIGLILNGTGTIIVNGREMTPVRGQLYLLPAGTVQTFFNDGKNPYLKYFCHFNVRIHGSELFEFMDAPLCITPADPDRAAALFEKLIASHNEKSLASFVRAKQCMMDLLAFYLDSCPEGSLSLIENTSDAAVNKAIAYAESHLDQAVSVAQMAEIAGYHPSHFTRLFRRRFGVSPAQFVSRKKAESAMDQLTKTNRSIADISNALGFSTQFYFCSFFKKQTGMTPSEYRQIYSREA